MSTDNLALAERIDTLCKGKLDTFALVKLEGYALEAARALRESAQREAELRILADAGKSWHDAETALRLRAITAERAIATAQADGFRRGVEAEREKIRRLPCYCAVVPETLRKYEMRTRGLSGLGIEFGAHSSDCPHYLFHPPTGAATETHEFVKCDAHEHDHCRWLPKGAFGICGLPRSHPIHGGR